MISMQTVISWQRFMSLGYTLRQGCAWIDDQSIQHCLRTGLLEDARHHQNEYTHHAARVAWLVKRLNGHHVDPIHLHIVRHKVSIYDGAHRLRAYQFLGIDNIPVRITADPPELLDKYIKKYNSAELKVPTVGAHASA